MVPEFVFVNVLSSIQVGQLDSVRFDYIRPFFKNKEQ